MPARRSARRPGPTTGRPPGWQPSALGLAALLTAAAVAHFRRPEVFDPTIPAALPGRARSWVLGSGVAELGTAALVLSPPTRRFGGTVAAGLFVAVFPANLTMARDAWSEREAAPRRLALLLARLPLQVPLVLWALRVRRSASGR